jgi:hypothetical protein
LWGQLVAEESSKTVVYFGLGQSLMEGVCRTKAVVSTDLIATGSALMFGTGPRITLFEN